jgi:hypothetical protein
VRVSSCFQMQVRVDVGTGVAAGKKGAKKGGMAGSTIIALAGHTQ